VGRERESVYDRNANACDRKLNKRKFTGNRYLSEILSQQKQLCPLVRQKGNTENLKPQPENKLLVALGEKICQ